MVEIIRNKWCDDLEEILHCPICFECPKNNPINQCIQGHHICGNCKMGLPQCPTCGQAWSLMRNRMAEDLCLKLDDIKLSLIDPEAEINKLLLPDTFCASTQTTEMTDDILTTTDSPEAACDKSASPNHTGVYPCCIETCNVNVAFDRLIEHITTAHFMHFIELPLKEDDIVFQHTWPIEFVENLQFDRAFRIPHVGTFFIKISSNEFGDFTGLISMIHSAFVAKQFSYQLKVECCHDHKHPCYIGDVNSCRTPILRHKSLQIRNADIKPMLHSKVLKCNVVITKKLYAEQERKKKNRAKKRSNAKFVDYSIINGLMMAKIE